MSKRFEGVAQGISIEIERLSDGSETFGVHIAGTVTFGCVDERRARALAAAICDVAFIETENDHWSPLFGPSR